MNLFKAHFVHPYIQVPLIVYFNKSEGHVTFETDEDMIKGIISADIDWINDENDLLEKIDNPPNICKTQYPVKTFSEVYDLLERLGIPKEDLEFKQIMIH